MSEIYREFERQLAAWHTRYEGQAEREILRLYLVALEREENVVVAYDARVLGPRLAKMSVPDDVRDVMKAALLQVWRDEEMHAAYVRRVLLEPGRPIIGVRTLLQQIAGAIGGWSVAVRQHRDWSEAPIARTLATLVVWTGEMLGRVPRTVRVHLHRCSLRDFCSYNVDTESTAWLCWDRLATLAADMPGIAAERVEDLRRIADDEARHGLVFGILADSLTIEDRLREQVTADSLARRLQDMSAPASWTERTSTNPHKIDRSCLA